jgi:PAS domain S-box-containing protein
MSDAPETFFTLRGAPIRGKSDDERARDRVAEAIPVEKMVRLNPRDAPVHVGGTGGGSGRQMSILAMTLLGFGALVAVLIASNVASIVQMREIGREFDRLRAVKETAETAADIDRGLAELRLSVGEFLGTGDETHAAFARNKADEISDQIALAKRGEREGERAAALDEIGQRVARYGAAFERVTSLEADRRIAYERLALIAEQAELSLRDVVATRSAQGDPVGSARANLLRDAVVAARTLGLTYQSERARSGGVSDALDAALATLAESDPALAPAVAVDLADIGRLARLVRESAESSRNLAGEGIAEEGRQIERLTQRLRNLAGRTEASLFALVGRRVSDMGGQAIAAIVAGAFLGLLCALAVARLTTGPVREIAGALEEVSAGRIDSPIPYLNFTNEIGRMARATEVFRQAMAEIQRAEQVMRASFENMDQGLALLDANFVLQVANSRFAQMLGLPPSFGRRGTPMEDIIRAYWETRIPDPGRRAAEIAERIAIAKRGERTTFELAGARDRILECRVNPTPEGGVVYTFTDVTRTRESERAAKEARRFLETVLDAMPANINVKDRELRYLLVNRVMVETYGFDRATIVGKTFAEVAGPQGELDTVARNESLDREIVEGKRGLAVYDSETLDLAGRKRAWLTTKTALRDGEGNPIGVVTVSVDIAERRQLEAALRESEAAAKEARRFLESVLDAMPAIVNVKDRNLRYSMINRYQAESHAMDPEQAIGRTMGELLGPRAVGDTVNRNATVDREILDGARDAAVFDAETIDAAGRPRSWLSTKSALRDAEGNIVGVLTVGVDIGERRKLETALRDAAAAAEEAARAKSEFLAVMSHEIRTPLNGVIGTLELLRRQPLSAEESELAGIAHDAAQSLIQIIGDILDFSKIEAGKLEIERVPLAPRRVVDTVVNALEPAASAKGLRLFARVAPDLPEAVLGDPLRLRQVLFNLVGNAVKFTERGEIEVSIAPAPSPGRWRFAVRDTGIGLSDAQRAKLFSAFHQADTSTTRKYGGTGLGLSICRAIVELLGGKIEVDSAQGEGSTFRFDVALDRCDPALVAESGIEIGKARAGAPVDRADAVRRGKLVLVAEDNPTNRRVVRKQLEQLGYAVDLAGDGREALEMARSGEYGLVLMDHHMPEMDGFDSTRAIRAFEAEMGRPRVPIVALTANALRGEAERSFEAGMDDFCAKPLTLAQLARVLRRWTPGKDDVALDMPLEAPTGPSDDHAVLDVVHLRATLGAIDDGLREDLKLFVDTTEDYAKRLAQAIEARDARSARETAHSAKGAARTAGARELAALMQAIEDSVRQDDFASAASLAGALRPTLDRVAKAVAAL